MTAFGYKQTYSRPKTRSAIPPGTDILAARLSGRDQDEPWTASYCL